MSSLRTVAALLFVLAASACSPDDARCEADADCAAGEVCVDGTCQQCRVDADCPAGSRCADGACAPVEGFCDDTHPCPSGLRCEASRCVATAAEVVTDACATVVCPAGEACADGVCRPRPELSCALGAVFYETDSDALDDEARRALQTSAQCVARLQLSGVHATGHADERGTEEYNLALSERRAQGVTRYLRSLGVRGELTASGMGEELATGADDAAWRHDRRVDLLPP